MLFAATSLSPYPNWLNPGDNTWQLVAATLVGLMSIPALAVLYGGLVQKKWIVNTMFMVFAGFSITLVVWVCWGYSMAFGPQAHLGATGSFWSGLVGNSALLVLGTGHASPGEVRGKHPRSVPLPDGDSGVLPVRLRGHHPVAVRRRTGRSTQVQGVAVDCAAVDHVRLLRERGAALGWWILRPKGRRGLLGWVRHPPLGGCRGIRRCSHCRTASQAGPHNRAEQPHVRRRWRRSFVARLERLQRW